MATAQEQLMGMLNPQTARLLDNQMRQKQVAQRSEGAGMLSGLTQAYTGMADAVTGAAGLTPMGANEQKAIYNEQKITQAAKTTAMQKEAVIASLVNNPELTPQAIQNITRAVNSGTMSVEAAAKLGIPTGVAPKTINVKVEDKLITKEWDKANQKWTTLATSDIGAAEVKAAKVAAKSKSGLQFIKANKTRIDKGIGATEQSQKAIKTIDSAVALLNKGVFTGSLAETKVQVIKLADLFGLDIGIDKASSTEEFGIILLDNLGPLVKSGMFGTGQSITNKDLEIAKSMIAGDPSKTEEAIRGILKKLYVGNQDSLKTSQEFMEVVAGIDSNYKNFTISEEVIEETQRVREFEALNAANGYVAITLKGVEVYTDKKGRLFDTQGYLIQTKKGG